MIGKLLDLISSTCPFPHILNDVKIDGLACKQPIKCLECRDNFCTQTNHKVNEIYLCPKGYNFYNYNVENKIIIINGVYLKGYCKKIPRKEKKSGSTLIKEDSIEKWAIKSNNMIKELEKSVHENVRNTLGMLHDVNTAVSIIFRNAESLIYEEAGETIDEKINNAPSNKKTLYKSIFLLEERLKMISLISNPESATHGDRNPIPIYKLFDKTIKMFQNIASKENISLKLHGTSYSSPWLYSSFSTIPLVLIDNAIKYSQPYQDIVTNINDKKGGVSVSVESFSLRIDEYDSKKIFTKNYRGKFAKEVAIKGSGLGLYLADIVAFYNGFKISHSEKGNAVSVDGLQYTRNIFSFFLTNSTRY